MVLSNTHYGNVICVLVATESPLRAEFLGMGVVGDFYLPGSVQINSSNPSILEILLEPILSR